MPTEANWTLSEGPVPEPGPNEMLARAIYLDVAPYMRGRISPQKNYAAGVKPGDVMIGGAHRRSRAVEREGVQAGRYRRHRPELRLAGVRGAAARASCAQVDRELAPLPYWLDALG